MSRLDVYTAVHKMQRARLFDLTVEAGRTDPRDRVAATRLAAAVDALVDELTAHAGHEHRFIHPLLRRAAPEVADALDAEHEELDARMADLRAVATADPEAMQDPNARYRALASFTATYLQHVAREEADALPALWGGCSDEELAGILASFKGARTDAENLTSVLAQLATLNDAEISQMASAGLGTVGVDEVADALATLLTPLQLGALRADRQAG